MKIAIISPDYPSDSSSAFGFVHSRSKLYLKFNHLVEVYVKSKNKQDYEFEGVVVHKVPKFNSEIQDFNPHVLAIHYPLYQNIRNINMLPYPKVAWIHGHEILWTFDVMGSQSSLEWLKKRLVLIPRQIYQLATLRAFLKKVDCCIFVSNWLLEAAERHTQSNFKNAIVIPNPVDTQLFSYRVPQNACCGISLRSLERRKYGLDMAIKAFSNLNEASLTIYGTGRFYGKYLQQISRLKSNTSIEHKNVKHGYLPKIYHEYGFFVAPSRREAQGLAMCEAMACGLPVVATNVGGIPEFVRNGVDGYLVAVNDPEALRAAVIKLISNKNKFYEMSRNARLNIDSLCSGEVVTYQELKAMEKASH